MWALMDYYPSNSPLTRTSRDSTAVKLNLLAKLFLEGPLESVTFCPPHCQRELASDIPECESTVQRFTAAVTPKQAPGLPRFWQVKVYDTLML